MAEKRWFKVTTNTGGVIADAYVEVHKTAEFIPVLQPGERGKAGKVYTLENGATLTYQKITRLEYLSNNARLAEGVLQDQAAIIANDGDQGDGSEAFDSAPTPQALSDQVDEFAELDRELGEIEAGVTVIERRVHGDDFIPEPVASILERSIAEVIGGGSGDDAPDLAGDYIDRADGSSVSLGAPVNYLASVANLKHGRRYGRRITFGVYRR